MRVLKNTVGNNEDTKDDMGFIEKVENSVIISKEKWKKASF